MSHSVKDFPPVDQLPSVPGLPDPFTFTDGSRVESRGEWERRRDEIKRLIQQYAYGWLPPAGDPVRAESPAPAPEPRTAARELELLLRAGPEGGVGIPLLLTYPDGPGPFPVLVTGDLCWRKADPAVVEEATRRGYILAEFDRTKAAPDADGRAEGLYADRPGAEFGAVVAWAWGFHRVIDYLLTLPEADRGKVAVTGHSRGGKAALLAGALDERIALTAPNNSGCMGAGCTRYPHEGETLEAITRVFPFWFTPRLAEFVGREDHLPFDQHMVKALVAPRALLSTEGLEDTWANPPGTQLTHQAARQVYEFLGAGDRIGIVFRGGGHGHTPPDWQALIDFADRHLLGKTIDRRFDSLHYPDESGQAFAWASPATTS